MSVRPIFAWFDIWVGVFIDRPEAPGLRLPAAVPRARHHVEADMIVHLPGPLHPIELPDVGEGICCGGALYQVPDGCTCWESVYEPADQVPLDQCDRAAPDVTRERMCDDCAFRVGSPERTGEGRYENSEPGDLERVVAGDIPFRCHDGARRIVAIVHTPTGHRINLAGLDHYDPPQDARRPYRADGRPLLVCAGWAAAHAQATKTEATP